MAGWKQAGLLLALGVTLNLFTDWTRDTQVWLLIATAITLITWRRAGPHDRA